MSEAQRVAVSEDCLSVPPLGLLSLVHFVLLRTSQDLARYGPARGRPVHNARMPAVAFAQGILCFVGVSKSL